MRTASKYLSAGWLLVAIVLSSSLAYPADKPLKKVLFLTNYVFHGRHSPYFVGLDKGFYKEAGFDVQIAPATGSGFVVSAL